MNVGSVNISGMRELGDKLDKLFKEDAKKAVREGVKSGAEIFKEDVQWRVPVQSGELLSKVTTVFATTRDGGYKAKVGIAYEGKRAESSRRKRAVKIKQGRVRNWWNQHGVFEGGESKEPSSEDPAVYAYFVEFGRPGKSGHTHQKANPFMRKAFDSKSNDVEAKFGEVVLAEIKKEIG